VKDEMSDVDLPAIRELAYRLWVARGRRHGHAIEDWLEAERQIRASRVPDPVAPVKPKRSRKRAKASSPAKAPTVPVDDAASTAPETPKVGSRDAPGG
jgi:Protein of unknown function (DUF2934)